MSRQFVLAAVFALTLASPIAVQAQSVLPPSPYGLAVFPSPAFEGAEVSARLLIYANCHDPDPGPSTITRQGQVVTFRHDLVRGSGCFGVGIAPPPRTANFPLGSFPAGDYTLVYSPTSGTHVYPTQTTQFTVLGAVSATPIPTLSWSVTALLVLAFGLAGVIGWRRGLS